MKNFNGNIYLIGFMGTGKSTISAEFVKSYGFEKLEMDEMIVEGEGVAITEIFATKGEDYFRDVESALLEEIAAGNGKIVSCGGGVVVREKNIETMKKSGKIVLLSATPETVYSRVKNSNSRPILNGNMNVEYIAGLMEKRRAAYLEAADVVVAVDGKDVPSICKEIIEELEKGN